MPRRRRAGALSALVVVAFVLAGCAPAPQNGDTVSTPAVVPAPASLEASGSASFVLTDASAITGDADAVATLRDLLAVRTGRASTSPSTGSGAGAGAGTGAEAGGGITLEVAPGGAAESYTLDASAQGVTVTGADAAGLFYGVQTLGQLIVPAGDEWHVPAVHIEDAPRFAYRGVMLDVARHFHAVDTVKGYIDRASALKFNILHLHLTDDQAWRLEMTSRPLLTEKASANAVGGDPGGFYTQDDYREIIAYAAAHHMIVVPEVDLPGHTHAVSLAYPELSEEPVITDHMREIARDYGGDLPVNGRPYDGMAVGFSSLKIHDEATWTFLSDVLGEIASLTPGPYLHIGGDECLGTSDEDYASFVDRVTALVRSLGKEPMAWHEAGSSSGIDPSTIGQYWGFRTPTDGMDDKARGFTELGSTLVLSPADAIYLDMKPADDFPLGLTWAGVVSARQSYEWDPAQVVEGVTDDSVLGVEAPLWSETVRTPDDIDALAFPRIASAAEAAWSPALGSTPERSWDSFARRVVAISPLWDAQGIGYARLDGFPWPDASEGAQR